MDHSKLESRGRVSFGLKSIVDFPSSHTHQLGKVWSRTILVHKNFFLLQIRCLLVSMYWFFVITFFLSTSVSLF